MNGKFKLVHPSKRRPLRQDVYDYAWGSVIHELDVDMASLNVQGSLTVDDLDELIGTLQVVRQEILGADDE